MSFVCAVMVVLIHVWCTAERGSSCWWTYQIVSNGVCRIAVPFFFVASGFFLGCRIGEPGWYLMAIKKRAISLGIPYVLWNFIATCSSFALGFFTLKLTGGTFAIGEISFPAILHAGGIDFSDNLPLVPLWYVRTLLFLIGLSFVVPWLWGGSIRLCVVWLVLVGLDILVIYPASKTVWWHTIFSLKGGAYFFVGLLFARHKRLYHSVVINNRGSVVALFLGGGMMCSSIFCGFCNILWLEHIMFLLAIPLLLFGVWHALVVCHFPKSLTALSFPIFLVHPFVIVWFESFLGVLKIGHALRNSFAGCFYRGLLICAISILVACVIRRLKFARLLFWGR